MRLAAIYTVFNGTEMLQKSIHQIKKQVDLTIIGMQEISNAGQNISHEDAMNCVTAEGELQESGYDAMLINYRPDLGVNRKENERRKLTRLIDVARNQGATHFVLLAADHFYRTREFRAAKEIAITNNVDVTLTRMYTYYKKPTWRLEKIEDYWMPFICRITAETKAIKENYYPVRVDPAVRISPANSFHRYPESEIMLHHYSMVRHDIDSKFKNAAAAQNWGKGQTENYRREYREYSLESNPGITYFGGIKVKPYPDIFGLESLDF